ncbi:hypothetical protein LUZ61_015027 [Rhynchospora tenuis]|uniref:t-SNARE coiled-coil homology domain-containing protein n=1 Tax=Rhynchospora tenuis TaxID=198213 RepID=A0AAD5WFL1_9POAL|nr:hypothetical protein LUZ61_015027 [Rhynchospora tenuis]
MNNLLSDSWRKEDIETGNGGGTVELTNSSSLDGFLKDADAIRSDIEEIERIRNRLHESNAAARTLHAADAVRSLRAKMDADVALVLKKARIIKAQLDLLERAAETSRALPGSGPGSSNDRTRMSILGGLKSKLKGSMDAFAELRKEIATEYRETVARRYYTVTGEQPDEATVEALVTSGEGEQLLQKAIAEQGRGTVMNMVAEIQERHNTMTDLERSLLELQQVFMDMAVLVQTQGDQLNDIENQVDRAKSFVADGRQSLQIARNLQKNSRKWMCIGFLLLIIIILAIVLPVVLKN